MISMVFSIYDNKAGAFASPFLQGNEEVALRGIKTVMAERPQDMMSRYPEDFELFYLGTFDDHDGKLSIHTPKSIGNIKILMAPQELKEDK